MGYYQGDDYYSDYSGPEIDNLLGKTVWQSNPNLLDNWYFAGGGSQQGGGQFPINQRGGYVVPAGIQAYADGTGADMGILTSAVTVTEIIPSSNIPRFYLNGTLCYSEPNTYVPGYVGTGYGIDRWISSGVVELNPQGISLSANATIFQRLGETQDLINGQIVTASILFDDKFYSGTITYQKSPSQNIVFVTNSSVSLLIGVDGDFYVISGSSVINACVAVKLELGDTQTLAHQENGVWVLNEVPNYQEQLARCQRYFQRVRRPMFIKGSGSSWGISIPTKVPLRSNPSVTFDNGYFITPGVTASGIVSFDTNSIYVNEVGQGNVDSTSISHDVSMFFLNDSANLSADL